MDRRFASAAMLLAVALGGFAPAGLAGPGDAPLLPTCFVVGDCHVWATEASPGGNMDGPSVAASADGNRVFTASLSGSVREVRGLAGATGAVVWSASQDVLGSSFEYRPTLATTPDGSRVFVSGALATNSLGATLPEWLTVAYDGATGVALWSQKFKDPTATGFAWVRDVVMSPDASRVYVGGQLVYKVGGVAAVRAATVAYDAATGALLWFAVPVTGAGGQSVADLAVAPDGTRVYAGAESCLHVGCPNMLDFLVLALDAATGTVAWTRRIDGPSQGMDQLVALDVRPGSDLVVATGLSANGCKAWDWLTVAYDAAGAKAWESRWTTPTEDVTCDLVPVGPELPEGEEGAAVAFSPDGQSLFVAGRHVSLGVVAVRRLDAATGELLGIGAGVAVPLSVTGQGRMRLAVAPDGSTAYVAFTSHALVAAPELRQRQAQVAAFHAAAMAPLWTLRYADADLVRPDWARDLLLVDGGDRLLLGVHGDGVRTTVVAYDL